MNVGELNRQMYLGGSDVAAILGISPWKTPLDTYLDKVEGSQPITDVAKLKILNRGKRLEPYVLDMLCEETGVELIARNHRYTDPEHGFLAAEIDAETSDGRNVESKTTADFYSRAAWGEEHTDAIPVYYTAQCMHGMMVKPAASTLLPVMLGIDDFRVYEVFRDEETIEAIRAKEIEFWQRVQDRNPPPPSTVGDVLRLFRKDAGTSIEISNKLIPVFAELRDLKKKLKLDEARIELAEEQIKIFMLDHAILTQGGAQLATWKSQDTNRFDQTAFGLAHPDLLEKFKRTTTSRVFRLKK